MRESIEVDDQDLIRLVNSRLDAAMGRHKAEWLAQLSDAANLFAQIPIHWDYCLKSFGEWVRYFSRIDSGTENLEERIDRQRAATLDFYSAKVSRNAPGKHRLNYEFFEVMRSEGIYPRNLHPHSLNLALQAIQADIKARTLEVRIEPSGELETYSASDRMPISENQAALKAERYKYWEDALSGTPDHPLFQKRRKASTLRDADIDPRRFDDWLKARVRKAKGKIGAFREPPQSRFDQKAKSFLKRIARQ